MADESQNSEDQRFGVKGGRTEVGYERWEVEIEYVTLKIGGQQSEVGGGRCDVGGRKWTLGGQNVVSRRSESAGLGDRRWKLGIPRSEVEGRR